MKHIICSGERNDKIEENLQFGPLSYRLERSWAQWPTDMVGTHVLNSCLDSDGNLYATTDKPEHPIVIFDPKGNYIDSIGQGLFKKAHSVVFTPKGTLLVADAHKTAHIIREISIAGEEIRIFGTPGVAGDSGYDFDYYDTMVSRGEQPSEMKWNKDPKANARLDSICRRGKPFCRPCSMFMSADGEFYAADGYGNCAVHCFDKNGSYRFSWGAPGQEDGSFRVVHDVWIDNKDRVWIADRENCRVQAFTRQGELLAIVSGNLMRIGGIWCDDCYLYIGELDGGMTIISLDALEPVGQIGSAKSLLQIHGVTGDTNGNLYLSTNKWNDNNILRLMRV